MLQPSRKQSIAAFEDQDFTGDEPGFGIAEATEFSGCKVVFDHEVGEGGDSSVLEDEAEHYFRAGGVDGYFGAQAILFECVLDELEGVGCLVIGNEIG